MAVYHSRQKRRLSMSTLQQPAPPLRLVVYVRCKGHCWFCGAVTPFQVGSVDHLVAVHQGGATTLANQVWACVPCNKAKGCLPLEEFRAQRGGGVFWGERETYA